MDSHLDSSSTDSYIQALINIARLWSQTWDAFFAVGATKKSEWLEIEIMDTKIINIQRNLPEELKWDPEKVMQHRLRREPETNLNRRLHIYTVHLTALFFSTDASNHRSENRPFADVNSTEPFESKSLRSRDSLSMRSAFTRSHPSARCLHAK